MASSSTVLGTGSFPEAFETSPSTASLRTHKCPLCPRAFVRIEHLRRHQRGHETHNHLACSVCLKKFSRSRHESLHIRETEQPDRTSRRGRACFECARVRGRCDKANTGCGRCIKRSLECVYPHDASHQEQRRSSPKSTENQSNRPSSSGDSRPPALLPDSYIQAYDYVSQDDSPALFDTRITPDEALFDPSINWLQSNQNIDIDYTSILELGSGHTLDSDNASPVLNWTREQISQDTTNTALETTLTQIPYRLETPQEQSRTPALDYFPLILPTGTTYQSALSPGGRTNVPVMSGVVLSTASELPSDSNSCHLIAQGGIYATSVDGSRIPCTARNKLAPMRIEGSTPLPSVSSGDRTSKNEHDFSFPDLSRISYSEIDSGSSPKRKLDDNTYTQIHTHFQHLCLDYREHAVYRAYTSTHFPRQVELDPLLHLFFVHFDPILPIYHDCIAGINDHWILALAVISIGAQYAEADEISRCVVPLHEFLRRALVVEWENNQAHGRIPSLALVQAMVLGQAGMTYYHGSSSRLAAMARTRQLCLVEAVSVLNLLAPSIYEEKANSLETSWTQWLLGESKRRLGYAIWLLDCMAVYHFGLPSLLSLQSAQCELPCDDLWAAQNVEDWVQRIQRNKKGIVGDAPNVKHLFPLEENPSLVSAVTRLFLERQMTPDLGEFCDLLLLHGVYQHYFLIREYYGTSLSAWIPSMPKVTNSRVGVSPTTEPVESQAHGKPRDADFSISSTTMSTLSALSSWRSAAMDCVDVLHWSANSTIARLAGAEHTTVLHLHLSRAILWSPFDDIRTLAIFVASSTTETKRHGFIARISPREASECENKVLEWAQRDEHKARLTALHCGTLFWHVRRYSRRAYYEPYAVFLATLVLWAYSVYVSRSVALPAARSNGTEETEESDGINNSGCIPQITTFIHLDRPCDDEMVQYFVRCGRPSVTHAHMAGVGNIYAPGGSERILHVGRELLTAVSTAWARTGEYVQILEALESSSATFTALKPLRPQ